MTVSVESALKLSRLLIGLSLSISSAELLRNRDMFLPTGLSPWPLLRSQHRRRSARIEAFRDLLLGERFGIVLFVRLIMSLLLLLPYLPSPVFTGVEVLLLLSNMTLSYRGPYGGDGSEQMNTVVLAGLAYTQLAPSVRIHGVPPGLAFIAIQLTLSYFVAGVAKAISPIWRSGQAVPGILRSSTYGLPIVAKWLDLVPGLGLALCWMVIIFEVSFPVVFVVGPRLLVAYLIIGGVFHIGNSIAMGLNTFLPAFLAGYPSLLITINGLAHTLVRSSL